MSISAYPDAHLHSGMARATLRMALITVQGASRSRRSCSWGQHEGEGGEDEGESHGAHRVVGTGELSAVVRVVVVGHSEAG